MVINAHGINGSDPGAVPGGSTKIYGAEIGSTNVKRCQLSLGGMATDIGAKRIVANDNYAPVAVAA